MIFAPRKQSRIERFEKFSVSGSRLTHTHFSIALKLNGVDCAAAYVICVFLHSSLFTLPNENTNRMEFKYSISFMSRSRSFRYALRSTRREISNKKNKQTRAHTHMDRHTCGTNRNDRINSASNGCEDATNGPTMVGSTYETYLVCKLSIKRSNVISSNRTKSWRPTSVCCTILSSTLCFCGGNEMNIKCSGYLYGYTDGGGGECRFVCTYE